MPGAIRTRPTAVPARDGQRPASPSFQLFLQTKVDRWHWPAAVLLSMGLIVMLTQLLPRTIVPNPRIANSLRHGGFAGAAATPAPMTEFEQQLFGCRSLKSGPIPHVDTKASLKALEGLTLDQQQAVAAYAEAVAACTSFECLRRVAALPRAPGQFRFPHFMVIGFPKCATTSIYCHLIQHPQVQYAKDKESHRLMDKCAPQLAECPAEDQREYLVDVLNMQEAAEAQFTKAAFDGSTHYAQEGEWLAPQMAEQLPWVKVVVSMRDPISQALAMFLHNYMHNRTLSCWDEENRRVFKCVLQDLEADDRARYAPVIQKWAQSFPKEQLELVQFEALTSKQSMAGSMQKLKSFLEVDIHLPSDMLPLTNWKHKRGDDDAVGRYWNMTRSEYQQLVDLAERNTREVLTVMDRHGMMDKQSRVDWLRRWWSVWQGNLKNNCEEGPEGACRIVVS